MTVAGEKEEKWEKPLWLIAKMSDTSLFSTDSMFSSLLPFLSLALKRLKNVANLHHTPTPTSTFIAHTRYTRASLYCCKHSSNQALLLCEYDQNRYIPQIVSILLVLRLLAIALYAPRDALMHHQTEPQPYFPSRTPNFAHIFQCAT